MEGRSRERSRIEPGCIPYEPPTLEASSELLISRGENTIEDFAIIFEDYVINAIGNLEHYEKLNKYSLVDAFDGNTPVDVKYHSYTPDMEIYNRTYTSAKQFQALRPSPSDTQISSTGFTIGSKIIYPGFRKTPGGWKPTKYSHLGYDRSKLGYFLIGYIEGYTIYLYKLDAISGE